MQMVLTELMDISKRNTTESTHKQGTAQNLGSTNSSSSRSSRPTKSQADSPQATALATSPGKRSAPSVVPPHEQPAAMAHSAQDSVPFADPANGGPRAVLAVALNDKLDGIAQQFDQLKHHQDATNCHSDESMRQLNKLLRWARYHDESEQALTDKYPFMDGRPAGNSQGNSSPQANLIRVLSKLTHWV